MVRLVLIAVLVGLLVGCRNSKPGPKGNWLLVDLEMWEQNNRGEVEPADEMLMIYFEPLVGNQRLDLHPDGTLERRFNPTASQHPDSATINRGNWQLAGDTLKMDFGNPALDNGTWLLERQTPDSLILLSIYGRPEETGQQIFTRYKYLKQQ